MTTLRDLWESKGLSPTELAARAGISQMTLYRMNRRDSNILARNIAKVCQQLGITREEYDRLEPDK